MSPCKDDYRKDDAHISSEWYPPVPGKSFDHNWKKYYIYNFIGVGANKSRVWKALRKCLKTTASKGLDKIMIIHCFFKI